ncbi:unnamed protein product [Sympodiomycopsis kandeliae]
MPTREQSKPNGGGVVKRMDGPLKDLFKRQKRPLPPPPTADDSDVFDAGSIALASKFESLFISNSTILKTARGHDSPTFFETINEQTQAKAPKRILKTGSADAGDLGPTDDESDRRAAKQVANKFTGDSSRIAAKEVVDSNVSAPNHSNHGKIHHDNEHGCSHAHEKGENAVEYDIQIDDLNGDESGSDYDYDFECSSGSEHDESQSDTAPSTTTRKKRARQVPPFRIDDHRYLFNQLAKDTGGRLLSNQKLKLRDLYLVQLPADPDLPSWKFEFRSLSKVVCELVS